jgi:hypothetical protein
VSHETLATSVALVNSLDKGFAGTVGEAVPITVDVVVDGAADRAGWSVEVEDDSPTVKV